MQFRFQPLRAAQAAGVLVRRAGGRLNYTKLLKLLHLADRHSLMETGTPITGDAVVNMENGPVLTTVYDCIKGKAPYCSSWQRCFRTEGYDLVLAEDAGDGELSDYDVELLETFYDRYKSFDQWDMINEAHTLPEWKDPSPARVEWISHDYILQAMGATPELKKAYEALNASVRQLDSVRVIPS